MEKFGIFELLDALSAFTSAEKEQSVEQRPDASDAAFSPPAYGAGYDPSRAPAPAEPSAPKQGEALSALLSRHEALSKKIDDKH